MTTDRELSSIMNSGELATAYLGGTTSDDKVQIKSDLATIESDIVTLQDKHSTKIVYIRTEADFPTPALNADYGVIGITLEDNVLYFGDWVEVGATEPTLEIAYPLLFPRTNSAITFKNRLEWSMQYKYTGTGAFLRGLADIAGQAMRVTMNGVAFRGDDVDNTGGKEQALYDFQGTDGKYRIHETKTSHGDFYNLGIIEKATFDSIHSGFLGNYHGITFKGNSEVILQNFDYEGGINVVPTLKPAMINTEGILGTFQLAEGISQIGSNEVLFDLQHTHTGGLSGGTFVTGTVVQGTGDTFTPTSSNQGTFKHIFLGNGIISDSTVNGSFFWSGNATETLVGLGNQNVWFKVLGTTVFETEDLERASVPVDNRILFTLESQKELTTYVNISAISSGQTPRLEFTIFKNGVQVLKGGQPVVFEFEANPQDPTPGGITIPLAIVDADYIELYGRNTTNTQGFTVVNGAFITN